MWYRTLMGRYYMDMATWTWSSVPRSCGLALAAHRILRMLRVGQASALYHIAQSSSTPCGTGATSVLIGMSTVVGPVALRVLLDGAMWLEH